MIGRLRGQLLVKQPPGLMIETGGVGYELEAPMSTFYNLPPVGETVTVFTHLLVREDAHTLYAFTRESDRALFRLLLKVSGVGARMALAILSGMDPKAFARCVREGDAAALVRLPGIGRKTAERLIVEMRDSMDGTGLSAAEEPTLSTAAAPENPAEEAVRALIALGYKPPEAGRMVSRVETSDRNSEEIIRLALQASLKSQG